MDELQLLNEILRVLEKAKDDLLEIPTILSNIYMGDDSGKTGKY